MSNSRPARRPVVWITDDSPLEAQFTQAALGPAYDYEHFSDGSIVVERLVAGGRQPDVLLLDWVMPTMGGDEVLKFLRARPATAELPVIVVTASRLETADIVQGLAIGANDYVPRPFVAEELRARVDAAIRARRLREVAERERKRLAAVGKLGRAFVEVGTRLEGVIAALVTSMVDGLCDGCAITIIPGATAAMSIARHRNARHEHVISSFAAVADPCSYTFASDEEAKKILPPAYHPAIDKLGMSAFAVLPFPERSPIQGMVTVMRDGQSEPFEPEDLSTIETCIEYAAMAFDNGLRMEAERAMRRQLQTILEQLPTSIIVAEPGGHITHVNQSAMELLPGVHRAHTIEDIRDYAVLKRSTGEALTPEQTPLAVALRGETVRNEDLEVLLRSGQTRYIRASAVPLRDARDTVAAAVAAFDDVTSEVTAAAERARTAEFQQYVLGIVSHDLKTPIQTMLMGLDCIKLYAADNEKAMQFAQLMTTTTRRMKGIIEQILDVTRARLGGGIMVTPAETDLDNIVESVLQELALAYPSAHFERNLRRVRGTWDPERLAQVVVNLVGNAIQHGETASPVWVETAREGDEALLRIRNKSKHQLTEGQLATMFSPFKREARPGHDGLGLGLYISSEILRAHHGKISVESDPAMTTFVVRLPLDPQAGTD